MSDNRPTTSAMTAKVTVTSDQELKTTAISGNGLVIALARNDRQTAFAGVAENSSIHGIIRTLSGIREKMLVHAVNNRTKERNYYQLYSRLLENEISDEEFDNELETNPDKYVISTDIVPTDDEFQDAILLSGYIMDTDTTGDIESLFSFQGKAFNEKCKNLLNGSLQRERPD